MSTAEAVRIEKKGAVATIVLDRADSLNILNSATLEKFDSLLQELERDGQIRCVVITGGRHFSAGADVRELKEKDRKQAEAFSRLGQRVCSRMENMRKPVIAAVNGYALGGGCELALACDIRIASENAKFGQPEVNLGIVPGFGGTQRLARLVGITRAKELVFTGRSIDAKEAERIGLVGSVVTGGELMEKVGELAGLLSQKSPVALGAAKVLINKSGEMEDGLQREVASFAECFAAADHTEGIKAFLEKRKPVFGGS
jgi:enoyl-CoA hydratase